MLSIKYPVFYKERGFLLQIRRRGEFRQMGFVVLSS